MGNKKNDFQKKKNKTTKLLGISSAQKKNFKNLRNPGQGEN